MHEHGKSDRPIVPKKAANKGEPPTAGLPAERLEERGLAKGNSIRHDRHRTQSRDRLQSGFGSGTTGSGRGQGSTVHHALAPCLRCRPAPGGLLEPQTQLSTGGGRHDVAGLRQGPRGPPRGPVGPIATRSVPSEAGQAGLYSQTRWTAETDRHPRSGGQDRPTGGDRGALGCLRDRFPRFLLRISTGPRRPPGVECPDCRNRK